MTNLNQNLYSNPKIQSHHIDRIAIVYIRQSTVQQVEKHTESTKLQYALAERAQQLGWPQQRVLIIDDDLGRSGATAEGRPGFQRLVAEVGLNHVGIVLGIETSRLARSCRDWHQLLEVCALFGTLIGDADGIYDPTNYNDRLLLGLKGTMSEAELHILKQRMLEGKRAKAKRGELGMNLPIGYVRHPSGKIQKDPDEQAQATVQLAFDLFVRFATVHAVLRYFVKHNIQMPCRCNTGLNKGELQWRRPNRPTFNNLFHNPIYTGAYVYGRRPTDHRKKKPGRPTTGRTVAKFGTWEVLLKDKLPAYISWEQYEGNIRQLEKNTAQGIGVVRQGPSLLSGLLICGRCGLRMVTQYAKEARVRYACCRMAADYAEPLCQSLMGKPLDELITKLTLEALQPAALEISLKATEDLEAERLQLHTHWKQRLERAQYEVERAFRQYNAVEPENRLVARSLEKQWEEALAAEEILKNDYTRFLAEQSNVLSEQDREAIRQLAANIPALWESTTTTAADKQTIIRYLVERVIVTIEGETEKVNIQIHWAGGHQTETEMIRPVAKLEQLSRYSELLNHVIELNAEGKAPTIIAEILNAEGWRPPKRRDTFNGPMVRELLAKSTQSKGYRRPRVIIDRSPNEWTINELAQKLEMSHITLFAWLKKGKLIARRIMVENKTIWLIQAAEAEIARLRSLRGAPRTWARFSRVENGILKEI
jgi:DNA invertase Pin-like site-specific DNA recombinase